MKPSSRIVYWIGAVIISGIPFATFYAAFQMEKAEGVFHTNPLYVLSVILAMFIPAAWISSTVERRFDRFEKLLKEKDSHDKPE